MTLVHVVVRVVVGVVVRVVYNSLAIVRVDAYLMALMLNFE